MGKIAICTACCNTVKEYRGGRGLYTFISGFADSRAKFLFLKTVLITLILFPVSENLKVLYGRTQRQVQGLEDTLYRMRRTGYNTEAGRTIRGSFEGVVAMPGKVQKTLKVLDGVLELLKKAA